MTFSFMPHASRAACELKRKVIGGAFITVILCAASPAFAQEHAAAAEGGGMIAALIWPTVNFIILCGILYHFLRAPLATYLTDRSAAIRRDLVEAAALKATAADQLAAIAKKLQALPGELEALRKRGGEEIVAEELRITAAAAAERDRLLEQTRREIDLQVRLAKREILQHAADLSMQLATERLKKEMTPADQAMLIDRYLTQVKPQAASSKPQA